MRVGLLVRYAAGSGPAQPPYVYLISEMFRSLAITITDVESKVLSDSAYRTLHVGGGPQVWLIHFEIRPASPPVPFLI